MIQHGGCYDPEGSLTRKTELSGQRFLTKTYARQMTWTLGGDSQALFQNACERFPGFLGIASVDFSKACDLFHPEVRRNGLLFRIPDCTNREDQAKIFACSNSVSHALT